MANFLKSHLDDIDCETTCMHSTGSLSMLELVQLDICLIMEIIGRDQSNSKMNH